MTFAQDIVFTEEMSESSVDDTPGDFSEFSADPYSTVIIGVRFVFTFVDWVDWAVVPNIREDTRVEDNVEEFKNSPLEFVACIFEHFV